ncbi:MAG: replication-relaxation family protein [Chloroflexota bacterium]|nr:replication-relaxation family protein [Chloroflexota bacterium]
MQLLAHAGYLKRVERKQYLSDGRKPYLYRLTRKGAKALAGYLGCEVDDLEYWHERDWRLDDDYLEHLIRDNDVRIAITRAVQDQAGAVELVQWLDVFTLKQTHSQDKLTITTTEGKQQRHVLIPDDYVHLRTVVPTQHDYHHFVEIDLGTEIGRSGKAAYRTWERKVKLYLAYFDRKAGESKYFARYGTHGGRVLTVTTSAQRLANLKRITEEAGGKQRFWFTTFEQVTYRTVLDTPIWQVARDKTAGLKPLLWGEELA